jgi:hypothetical protein
MDIALCALPFENVVSLSDVVPSSLAISDKTQSEYALMLTGAAEAGSVATASTVARASSRVIVSIFSPNPV